MADGWPAVVFALRRESLFFRRASPFAERLPGAPCPVHLCHPSGLTVLALESGPGAAAVGAALRWCLGAPLVGGVPYRPRVVLSAGFSGALQADQCVGDLVLATEVLDEAGTCLPATWPDGLPPQGGRPALWRGRLLTVSHLVTEPQEKRRLGRKYRAAAVDMETAVGARLCRRHGVPFGCLRVISDDLSTPLSPRLADLLRHGRVSPPRLAGALLRRPTLAFELWRLAGQTRKAAEQLSLGLGRLLESAGRAGGVSPRR
jgi:nucleoside phosphorylase